MLESQRLEMDHTTTVLLRKSLSSSLRHNRKGVPKEIKSLTDRAENSTEVWWESTKGKMTITSYVVQTK